MRASTFALPLVFAALASSVAHAAEHSVPGLLLSQSIVMVLVLGGLLAMGALVVGYHNGLEAEHVTAGWAAAGYFFGAGALLAGLVAFTRLDPFFLALGVAFALPGVVCLGKTIRGQAREARR